MSEGEDDRIARLEALLARVRSRARTDGVLTSAPALAPHAPLANGARAHDDRDVRPPMPSSPFDAPTPMAAFRPSPVPPPLSPHPARESAPQNAPRFGQRPLAPPIFAVKPTAPPTRAPIDASLDKTLVDATADATTPPRRRAPLPEPSGVRAVDPPPMEVVELDVDPDPSIPPPSVERVDGRSIDSGAAPRSEELLPSRSRLVSAPPVAPPSDESKGLPSAGDDDTMFDSPADAALLPSDPTIEAVAVDVTPAELEAIEAADRAPTSSRRPISMEEKMSELEDDSMPLHTPPPESGKLPAASPAIELSLESSPALLVAVARESVRAEPFGAAAIDVALFVGRAPGGAAATTFGDLLDATLSL